MIVDKDKPAIEGSRATEETAVGLEQLERQMGRGHLFANSALGESFRRRHRRRAVLLATGQFRYFRRRACARPSAGCATQFNLDWSLGQARVHDKPDQDRFGRTRN